MSNHNYKQYYNNKPKEKPYATEKPEKVKEPVAVEEQKIVEPVAEPVVESIVEATETAKPITGKVVGCKMLNVRIAPRKFADVVTVVNADSELIIDLDRSNDEWYSVCTAAGVEGYCMKDFVKI